MKKLLILGVVSLFLFSPVALAGYGLLSSLSFGGSAVLDSIPNDPPVISNPNPANNSINREIALIWNVTIQDPDGNVFNWTIECNNSQSSNANGASNGSKTLSLSSLSYDTQYTIWVNATDGVESASVIYYFTTKMMPVGTSYHLLSSLSFGGSAVLDSEEENNCPVSSGFSIVNGSTDVVINIYP